MALHENALMADLRGAIRHYRVIRFVYEGRNFVVEPHTLGRNPVTGTFELTAWVRSGPPAAAATWMTFNYWKVRALEVLSDRFLPRIVSRGAPQAGGREPRGELLHAS
jgi:hypothetical protein